MSHAYCHPDDGDPLGWVQPEGALSREVTSALARGQRVFRDIGRLPHGQELDIRCETDLFRALGWVGRAAGSAGGH